MASSSVLWTRPSVSFEAGMPPARGGHTSNQIANLMIVFGGTYYFEGKFNYLNDVWALDTDRMRWYKPVVAGKVSPGPRYGHASTVIDTKIYIFGGKGEHGLLYNDLWCLDIEQWTWELLSTTSAPPSPRLGHSMVAVSGKLVVTFGWDSKIDTYNDVWVYSLSQQCWLRPKINGQIPEKRYGAICLFDERAARLIVYGGATYDNEGKPSYLKDTRELELRTMTWKLSQVSGDFPSSRYWHGGTVIGNVIVSFGGWHGPEDDKKKTSSNTGGSSSSLASTTNGNNVTPNITKTTETIIINHKPGMGFGAEAPPGSLIEVPISTHPDCYFLDLDTLEWIQPQIAGKAPNYRYGCTLVPFGMKVLMYGGWEDGRPLSDILVLDMEGIVSE